MGRYMLVIFTYGRCCKGGCSPALSADSAQGDSASKSSRHTHPSLSKTQTKNQLHVAQPHPGHRLSKSTLSPPQSVSQRKLPTGDFAAIRFGASDWAEYPRQVRESRTQHAQGHLLRGSLWEAGTQSFTALPLVQNHGTKTSSGARQSWVQILSLSLTTT